MTTNLQAIMTKYLFFLALFAVLLIAQSAQKEENVIPDQEKIIDEKITDEKTIEVQVEDDSIDGVEKTYHKKCPCKCYVGHNSYIAVKQCRYKRYCKLSTCKRHGHYGKKCCGSKKPPSPCPCKCVSKHTAYRQCRHKKSCHVTRCSGHGYYPKYKCCGRY